MIAGAGLDIWLPSPGLMVWAGIALALAAGWVARGFMAGRIRK